MCFNRFFRVSKQFNGIWHQLHFFSSFSWELSISPQKEVGEGIGVVSKMLKESWTKIWVRRLNLCCWRSSLILAARWDCLIISDFKDLFSHLRKKAWKRCTMQEDLQWIVVWWKKIVLLTEDDWLFAKAQSSSFSSSETLSDVYFPHRSPLPTAPFDKII